jgi:hypothetical protein
MKERYEVRQVVVDFTPQELLQFFTEPDSIWHVKCRGLPSDCQVVGVEWNARRQVITFVLETEQLDRFFQIGEHCEAPCAPIYEKVELIGHIDSNPRSQRHFLSGWSSKQP